MNVKNSCYINAILQSLLYLPPFYNLYKKMIKLKLNPNIYPLSTHMYVILLKLTHSMHFISEFLVLDKTTTKIEPGNTFFPNYLLDYFNSIESKSFHFGKQQDSQEFLGWLLEELSKELSRTKNNISNEKEDKLEYDDDWEEVGKNSKSQKVQEVKQKSNSLSLIFSGKFKSSLKKRNTKPILTLEPFFTLHLPIDDSVESIHDSLNWIAEEEVMENDTKRQTKIEELPKVLILHLKRFTFDKGLSTKISKKINYDEILTLPKSLLSNPNHLKEYQLYSVVCHHGKDGSSGHYSTYVYHSSDKWAHIDDTKISFCSSSNVLKQQAYLLFYIQKK